MRKFLLSTFAFAMTVSFASAESNDYFEGFEGWDSRTDWLPEGWTEQNTDENIFMLNEGAFTWHVSNREGTLPHPPEGSCYAVVYYAYETDENGKKVDLYQDEWMISPSYKVTENSTLSFFVGYSPLYLFDLNNENINWGKMEFIDRKPSTTLKIYIRSNGGEWVMLKDLYEEWAETSLNNLFNNYSSVEFRQLSFDLAEYAGTDVQVAFQFVGMYGNTMEIDAFQITDATVGVDRAFADQRVRTDAYIQGGEIVINPSGAKSVDIYAANAGLVASKKLDGVNSTCIDGLASGLYLLRFNDGTVVKIMK
ncbi:MAG: T9SS type A sorting domain-containing protein [Bacteroidales bacterium]|nr:T9SS type A sorting domain-containing protein [Bacteroidales bacterium]